MGIGQDHLELVSDSHTSNHVSNNATNSAEDCISLLFLEPHSEFKSLLFGLVWEFLSDFDGNVFESSGQGAEFALDDHFSRLSLDGYSFGNI